MVKTKIRITQGLAVHLSDTGLSQVGGLEGALAPTPPIVGRIVNPISTRGADYAHQSTLTPPQEREKILGRTRLSSSKLGCVIKYSKFRQV